MAIQGPGKCPVCGTSMVPLFTSFYCSACEKKNSPWTSVDFSSSWAEQRAIKKGRFTLPTAAAQPAPFGTPPPSPTPWYAIWTIHGHGTVVNHPSQVPAGWSWAKWWGIRESELDETIYPWRPAGYNPLNGPDVLGFWQSNGNSWGPFVQGVVYVL